jgi:hypothetical protein
MITKTKATLSVDIVKVDVAHISSLHGKDGRIVELNVVCQLLSKDK